MFRLILGFLTSTCGFFCLLCLNLAQKLQSGAFGTFVAKVSGQRRRNYLTEDHICTIICTASDADQYLS